MKSMIVKERLQAAICRLYDTYFSVCDRMNTGKVVAFQMSQ